MSRTYRLRRNGGDFQGVRKEWVLVNKRGAKKFQRMVNKRCRRLDKIVIAEGINEMIDDRQEDIATLKELFFDEWYEDDPFEDPENWYGEEPEEEPENDYEEEPWDDYEEDPWNWDNEYFDSLYY